MKALEDGDTIEINGDEFILDLVDTFTANEWTVKVFHERSDEELTDVQDHFTVEVFEIDMVTDRRHNLQTVELIKLVFSHLNNLGF